MYNNQAYGKANDMAKIIKTKKYKFVGDVYEYYGQDLTSKQRTHSDVGWRLRSKKYGGISTFAKTVLSESIEDRICPLKEKQSGIYILSDSIFPEGFYIGKGKCIHDRIWKHGVKLAGTSKWNKSVETTKEFEKYRQLRNAKGLTDLNDVEIAFWFTKSIDDLEDQLLGGYTTKYGRTPYCNDTEEAMFDPWDI